MKNILSIVFIMVVFAACQPKKIDRKLVVQEELQKRIISYKEVKTEKCKEDMMEKINLEVDSMMYYLVQKMNGTSDEMPKRPNRPSRLVDTITLEEKPTVLPEIVRDTISQK